MVKLVRRPLRLVALILALQSSAGIASAAVSDIKSGLLHTGEVFPGLAAAHSRLYVRFHSRMDVAVTHGTVTRYSSTCIVPSSFASHWAQGVIESFDSTAPPSRMQILTLCGYRFTSVAAAQAAYKVLADPMRGLLRSRSVISLGGHVIGAQSIAVGSTKGLFTDSMVFRNANAVVQITYLGPQRVAAAQFVHLGGISNSRLR